MVAMLSEQLKSLGGFFFHLSGVVSLSRDETPRQTIRPPFRYFPTSLLARRIKRKVSNMIPFIRLSEFLGLTLSV